MAYNQYLVSIIIPTYNRRHLLESAVRSVLTQSYDKFELIVVDDGSEDNTFEVIEAFRDSRIKYIKHEKNRGVAAARNTGIQASCGEFVAFQDDDDIWQQKKLEKQMDLICTESKGADVVYTRACKTEKGVDSYIPSGKIRALEGNIYRSLLWQNYITIPSVLLRKTCLEKVGLFDENLVTFEDWEFLLRLSRYYNVMYIAEPLVIVNQTHGSLLSKEVTYIKALDAIMEKNSGEITNDRRLLARYLSYRGNIMCLTGDIKGGRNYILQALKTLPFDISLLSGYLVSYTGEKMYSAISKLYLYFARRI